MKLFSGFALVLATFVLAACGGASDDPSSTAPPSDQTAQSQQEQPKQEEAPAEEPKADEDAGSDADEAAGKETFASTCASCHTLAAADASGAVGPNLDEVKPDQALVHQMVEDGGGGMPAFADTLSADEITNVSAFVANNAGK